MSDSHSILIVEDDEITVEMLKKSLESDNYKVRSAINGKQALDMINNHKPGLILLDLMMPEMDGFQFAERLREKQQWLDIPVVVITAKDLSKEDIGFTKKEVLKLEKEKDKLNRSLGGISNMNRVPEMIFVIDTNVESLAIKEAIKLKIPIVAVLDSNSDPTGINFPIPGNDDARRSIDLYCELLKSTIIDAKKNIALNQNSNDLKKKSDNIDNKNQSTKTNNSPEDTQSK